MIFVNIYLPYLTFNNLNEIEDTSAKIEGILHDYSDYNLVLAGDLNCNIHIDFNS